MWNSDKAIDITIAAGDSGVLVVCDRERVYYPGITVYALLGWSVSRGGQTSDSSEIVLAPDRAYYQHTPQAVFDGMNYFVMWDGNVGTRVTQSDSVIDPHGMLLNGVRGRGSIVAQGATCTIVWPANRHLNGARIRTSGQTLDTFPVVAQPGSQDSPVLAANSTGQILLCYRGWAGNVEDKDYRAMRIWGKLGPFGGVAEGGSLSAGRPSHLRSRRILSLCPSIPQSLIPCRFPDGSASSYTT